MPHEIDANTIETHDRHDNVKKQESYTIAVGVTRLHTKSCPMAGTVFGAPRWEWQGYPDGCADVANRVADA